MKLVLNSLSFNVAVAEQPIQCSSSTQCEHMLRVSEGSKLFCISCQVRQAVLRIMTVWLLWPAEQLWSVWTLTVGCWSCEKAFHALHLFVSKWYPRRLIITWFEQIARIVGKMKSKSWSSFFNLFTTIHDGHFRRHSSINVTIKWNKFSSNIYYIYVFFVIWCWKLR